jgi:hypothetical protein
MSGPQSNYNNKIYIFCGLNYTVCLQLISVLIVTLTEWNRVRIYGKIVAEINQEIRCIYETRRSQVPATGLCSQRAEYISHPRQFY